MLSAKKQPRLVSLAAARTAWADAALALFPNDSVENYAGCLNIRQNADR